MSLMCPSNFDWGHVCDKGSYYRNSNWLRPNLHSAISRFERAANDRWQNVYGPHDQTNSIASPRSDLQHNIDITKLGMVFSKQRAGTLVNKALLPRLPAHDGTKDNQSLSSDTLQIPLKEQTSCSNVGKPWYVKKTSSSTQTWAWAV